MLIGVRGAVDLINQSTRCKVLRIDGIFAKTACENVLSLSSGLEILGSGIG